MQQWSVQLYCAKVRQMLSSLNVAKRPSRRSKAKEVIIIESVSKLSLCAGPRDGWVAERLTNVLCELAQEVTSWRIIAHSEVGRNVTAGVGKAAAGAVVSRAANFAGALPDDL